MSSDKGIISEKEGIIFEEDQQENELPSQSQRGRPSILANIAYLLDPTKNGVAAGFDKIGHDLDPNENGVAENFNVLGNVLADDAEAAALLIKEEAEYYRNYTTTVILNNTSESM